MSGPEIPQSQEQESSRDPSVLTTPVKDICEQLIKKRESLSRQEFLEQLRLCTEELGNMDAAAREMGLEQEIRNQLHQAFVQTFKRDLERFGAKENKEYIVPDREAVKIKSALKLLLGIPEKWELKIPFIGEEKSAIYPDCKMHLILSVPGFEEKFVITYDTNTFAIQFENRIRLNENELRNFLEKTNTILLENPGFDIALTAVTETQKSDVRENVVFFLGSEETPKKGVVYFVDLEKTNNTRKFLVTVEQIRTEGLSFVGPSEDEKLYLSVPKLIPRPGLFANLSGNPEYTISDSKGETLEERKLLMLYK